MNPYWGPHVLASFMRLRVIVYQHNIPDNMYSIVTFHYNSDTHHPANPHIIMTRFVDITNTGQLAIHRISVAEFRRFPTIELLFQYTGLDKPGHFQYLRRIICSGIPKPSPNTTKLRDAIRAQHRTTSSPKRRLGKRTNETLSQLERNTPKAKGSKEKILKDIPKGKTTGAPYQNVLVGKKSKVQSSDKHKAAPPERIKVADQTPNKRKATENVSYEVIEMQIEETSILASPLRNDGKSGNPQTTYSPQNNPTLSPGRIVPMETMPTLLPRVAANAGQETDDTNPSEKKSPANTTTNIQTQQKENAKSIGKNLSASNKKAKQTVRSMDTRKINELYNENKIPAIRVYYDSTIDQFYMCSWDENVGAQGGYTKKETIKDVQECHPFLIEVAIRRPNEWVGPPPGDAGDGEAPERLNTSIKTIYQQHNNPYCLTYSLASALFYCGFKSEAQILAEQAPFFSQLHFDETINVLRMFMQNLVPIIGLPTLYGIRTKRHSRVKRTLTWDELYTCLTPYPTIIIPMTPDGTTRHAFCVVDDLIFDSITPQALQLRRESIQWIFNDVDVLLHKALRFNMKISPKGSISLGKYTRPVATHWNDLVTENNK